MLVTRKKYDALERERAFLADSLATYRDMHEVDGRTIATLRARLAKFTAPRARDGAGRFLPLPAGDMGEIAHV
jgi:hypothetical protein